MTCPLEKAGLEPFDNVGHSGCNCRDCVCESECYNPDESKRPKDISELNYGKIYIKR